MDGSAIDPDSAGSDNFSEDDPDLPGSPLCHNHSAGSWSQIRKNNCYCSNLPSVSSTGGGGSSLEGLLLESASGNISAWRRKRIGRAHGSNGMPSKRRLSSGGQVVYQSKMKATYNHQRALSENRPIQLRITQGHPGTSRKDRRLSSSASHRTSNSTPGNFSPAWSNRPSEDVSSDGDCLSSTRELSPDWEQTDPIARGLREEIDRVRTERESMENELGDIDERLKELYRLRETSN